jgi:hypothetical protein
MDFEFDKEIDSLLRRTAGESVRAFDAHPDADEISLFAENALTTKARARAVEHLAECARCRKILSNVISFKTAAESEKIHAEESKMIPVALEIPWYRRLFAFPQITFAMGALVLVFAGIMAVLVLQTANDSQNVSVARSSNAVGETTKGTSGASSDGETRTVETYSTNSSNMSNSASVNPGMMSNSNMTTANIAPSNSTSMNANSTANVALPAFRPQQPSADYNEPAKPRKENDSLPDGQSRSNTAALSAPSTSGARPNDDAKRDDEITREKTETKDNQLNKQQAENKPRPDTPSPKLSVKKSTSADKNKTGEAQIIVDGKTFRNLGGTWFDSAYNSQPQIMIRRGSDDYKRLDSGLRRIAENIGGTVVVLWKSKAYRIHP